jgi:hypothetical protein
LLWLTLHSPHFSSNIGLYDAAKLFGLLVRQDSIITRDTDSEAFAEAHAVDSESNVSGNYHVWPSPN